MSNVKSIHSLKNQKQKEFYNSSNPQYLDIERNKPYAEHLIKRLFSQLPNNKKLDILEIGAGQGRFTFELATYAGTLTATDLSKKQIKILRDKCKMQTVKCKMNEEQNSKFEGNTKNSKSYKLKANSCNIDCFVHDLLKPPPKELKNNKFDAIVGFFMLHHIDRTLYPEVLNNLLPLLKNSGRLVFIEPNCLYPFHLVEMMIEPDMHWEIEKQIYSNYLGKFKQTAERAGLRQLAFERFGFFPPPLINSVPSVVYSEKFIERIPIFQQFLTPFVLISYC